MTRLYKAFKKYHKWLGITLAIFFMFFALSGIVLNHRNLFSGVDIKRSWLPKEYRYSSWNNAAIRGAINISPDSVIVFGNIGIWKTCTQLDSFTPLNNGFPKGVDNRKVSEVIATKNGNMFAATLFGLYRLKQHDNTWQKVQLPINEERIVALEELGDSLLVMSRSYLLVGYESDSYKKFSAVHLSPPEDADGRVSLFKTIWLIHSGEIWGNAGKIIVDIGGLAMLFLSVSGLFYFFAPKLLKRIKERTKLKSAVKTANRWGYQWHLKLGIATALLLILVTATGIFLRPPLLIPIASKTVKPIKGSKLDSPNHWNDKLRDVLYDAQKDVIILATSDGLYFSPTNFAHPPLKSPLQPPVSVMGINVLWNQGNGNYAVGSFSGMYLWNPYTGQLTDYLSGKKSEVDSGLRSPFGLQPIAGGIKLTDGTRFLFDYNTGAFSPNGRATFPAMPQQIIEESGMSLWNLALEVHTWRIIKFMVNDFYILVVPVAGLLGIVIITTGSAMWIMRRQRKSPKKAAKA